jgi:hypothetical protein
MGQEITAAELEEITELQERAESAAAALRAAVVE